MKCCPKLVYVLITEFLKGKIVYLMWLLLSLVQLPSFGLFVLVPVVFVVAVI